MPPPTPIELKPGARVFHVIHKRAATVKAQPRARSEVVQLQMDGNISAQYYTIGELILGDVPPPSGYVPPPEPAISPTPPVDQPQRDPLEQAIAATVPKAPHRPSGDVHQGNLTLDYLIDQRRAIARNLEAFDERIAELRVLAMLRRALSGIRVDGESGQRAELSADALKMKHDTARLLAAAERLAAKGAL